MTHTNTSRSWMIGFTAIMTLFIGSVLVMVRLVSDPRVDAQILAACKPFYSGITTVKYVNGQANSQFAHVTLPASCANPSVVAQTFQKSLPCGNEKSQRPSCANNPKATLTDLHARVAAVTPTGFDVFLSADDGVWLGEPSSPDFPIAWQATCGDDSQMPVCIPHNVVSGVADVNYPAKSPAHVSFAVACVNPSIVTFPYSFGAACGTSPCPNNPGSTSTDIHSYVSNLTVNGFDIALSSDDVVKIPVAGRVAYQATCNAIMTNTTIYSGVATVTYPGATSTKSALTHITLPASCANPSVVTQTYRDGANCTTSPCKSSPGTSSTDIHAYAININATGFDLFFSSDNLVRGPVTGTVAWHVACDNARIPPPAPPVPDQACNLSTMPLRSVQGLQSITIHAAGTNNVFTMPLGDPRLSADITESPTVADATNGARGSYDFFLSDEHGNVDPKGAYLTIDSFRNALLMDRHAGNNIDAVTLTFDGGRTLHADLVAHTELGYGLGVIYQQFRGFAQNALKAPDTRVTSMGDRFSSLTLGFCEAFVPPPPPPTTQCMNGMDDDGDERIDYPEDTGCTDPNDREEFNPRADLSATLMAPATVDNRQSLGFVLNVQNLGPDAAEGVVAALPLPAGSTLNRDLTAPTVVVENNMAIVRMGTIPANQGDHAAVVYTISQFPVGSTINQNFRVASNTVDPDVVNNTSDTAAIQVITLPQCSDFIDNDRDNIVDFPFEPGCANPQDNDESDDTTQLRPDLLIEKTGPSRVPQNGMVEYLVTVRNIGQAPAASAVVRDQLASNVSFMQATTSSNCRLEQSTVICDMGAIEPGASAGVTIAVRLSQSRPECSGQSGQGLINEAEVIGPIDEVNRANNRTNPVFTQVSCYYPEPTPAPRPFTIEINGPGQQSYPRGQQDAVLANVILTGDRNPIVVRKLFIAVQGMTAAAEGLGVTNTDNFNEIHEMITDVTLRNVVTGRVHNGVRLTDSNDFSATQFYTYQIYRFDDITVSGREMYEFRTDFLDNGQANSPKHNDHFRMHICTEPTTTSTGANPVGCTFNGIMPPSLSYQLQVEALNGGNTVFGVRPGDTVSGNPHRIADASLAVAVKNIGSTDTVVANAKNVNLLRFEAHASESNILFTVAEFVAQQGTLANGENYSLWVDTDNNGIVDTTLQRGASPLNDKLIFSEMIGRGFIVPKDASVVFEVHADIPQSPQGNVLQLAFDTASQSYVRAENSGGVSLTGINTNGAGTGDITVTTVPSMLYTIKRQGNLYVSRDTTPVRQQLLLGGSPFLVQRLNFRAEYEDIDVTVMHFSVLGGQSIDYLALYKDGDTTPLAFGTVTATQSDVVPQEYNGQPVTTFTVRMQNRQLVVPKGQDLKIRVMAGPKPDATGGRSGERIQFVLLNTSVIDGATGEGTIHARGDLSTNSLNANNGDNVGDGEVIQNTQAGPGNTIISGEHTVTMAKISLAENANPDSNGINIPTGPSRDIGQFRFYTEGHNNSNNGLNNVVIDQLVFAVNAQNVSIDLSSFKIYNKADSSIMQDCTLASAASQTNYFVVCSSISSSINSVIEPGTDQTFVLRAAILNAKVNSASVSTLQVSTDLGSNFQWYDRDAGTNTLFKGTDLPDLIIKSTSYQS